MPPYTFIEGCRRPEGRPAAASITQTYPLDGFFLGNEMQVIRHYHSWGTTAAGRSPESVNIYANVFYSAKKKFSKIFFKIAIGRVV